MNYNIISYLKSCQSYLKANDFDKIYQKLPSSINPGELTEFFYKDMGTIDPLKYMTKIPKGFAEGCEFDGKFVIGDNIKKIEPGAFEGSAIKLVDIDCDCSLPNDMFKECFNLVTVTINGFIDTIPNNCFKGCVALKKVYLPESVKFFKARAFDNCDSVTIITPYRERKQDKISYPQSEDKFYREDKHLRFTKNKGGEEE